MLKLGRVTKVTMLFLVLVFVFNFDLFKFSAAILEKGLLPRIRKFPFRKRSMPFSRHLEIFLTVNEFFSTKLKKKENF